MFHTPLSARALAPPPGKTTIIGTDLIRQAIDGSRQSPRKRIILPLHKGPESALHRMLNAVQPYSYIQPHRHFDPPKAESILVLQGAILSFVFSPAGTVREVRALAAGSDEFGVDSEPGVYHSFVALLPDTVLFEVKPGPYEPCSDKDFAPWAPPENSPAAKDYVTYLYGFARQFDCRIPEPG